MTVTRDEARAMWEKVRTGDVYGPGVHEWLQQTAQRVLDADVIKDKRGGKLRAGALAAATGMVGRARELTLAGAKLLRTSKAIDDHTLCFAINLLGIDDHLADKRGNRRAAREFIAATLGWYETPETIDKRIDRCIERQDASHQERMFANVGRRRRSDK